MTRRVARLTPVAPLAPLVEGGEPVAFNVGPDGVLYLVVARKPAEYREVLPNGVSFARTVPEQPQTYRVVGLRDGRTVLDVTVADERFNVHDVQPVGRRLLLACARSRYRGPDDYDRNGRLYTRGGKFVRGILLGDGIQAVQATAAGAIWTSYFDEGVFGNFGWQEPVGASGLIAWDATGRKRYEFRPPAGLDAICDCYALNVASDDDVWLCYYTEFPLVRLHRQQVAGVWKVPVAGSHAFAVAGEYALFQGGYGDHNRYHLLRLGEGGRAEKVAAVELCDPDGRKLEPVWTVGRGEALWLVNGGDGCVYRFGVREAAATAGVTKGLTVPKRRPRGKR